MNEFIEFWATKIVIDLIVIIVFAVVLFIIGTALRISIKRRGSRGR